MVKAVLGVTGGIAAYKAGDIIRGLRKKGFDVTCIMTKSAKEFITPLTLRKLSDNPVYEDMFGEGKKSSSKIRHIDLARSCDVIVIVPATANIIGKIANGIADDLLSTVIMATQKTVIIAPAMNTQMWVETASMAIPRVAKTIPVIMVGMAFLFFTILEMINCKTIIVPALITVICSTSKNQLLFIPKNPRKLLMALLREEAST